MVRGGGWRAERGVTLIEMTVMVIATLILVFALMPSVTAVIRNARGTAALNYMTDMQTAILAVQDDMQIQFFTFNGSTNVNNIIYLLVTDGDIPREVSDAATMATWQTPVDNSTTTRYDFLARHLITNNPPGGSYNQLGNPEAPARGWRGPYLNPPIPPDPWGNRYAINSQFFHPEPGAGGNNDVIILSAGQNEIIETVFAADPLSAGGDDVILLLQS